MIHRRVLLESGTFRWVGVRQARQPASVSLEAQIEARQPCGSDCCPSRRSETFVTEASCRERWTGVAGFIEWAIRKVHLLNDTTSSFFTPNRL